MRCGSRWDKPSSCGSSAYASTDYSSWISATSFIAALAGIGLGLFIDRLGVKRFYLGALIAYGVLATAVGFSASRVGVVGVF